MEPVGIKVTKALIVLIIMSEWEKASKASGSWADDLKNENVVLYGPRTPSITSMTTIRTKS